MAEGVESGNSGLSSIKQSKEDNVIRNEESSLITDDIEDCCNEVNKIDHKEDKSEIYRNKIKKTSICILISSLISIIISTLQLHSGGSAGTGIWCPVFMFLSAIINYSTSVRPSKLIIWTFGIGSLHFATIMFVVGVIEYIAQVAITTLQNKILNAILCAIAALLISLILFNTYLSNKLYNLQNSVFQGRKYSKVSNEEFSDFNEKMNSIK